MARYEVACAECGAVFTASRRDARLCSARCRDRARRRREHGPPPDADPGPGPLRRATDALLAELEERQALTVEHVALCESARVLADRLDHDPGSPGLWLRFHGVEAELRGLLPSSQDAALWAFVAELRAMGPDTDPHYQPDGAEDEDDDDGAAAPVVQLGDR